MFPFNVKAALLRFNAGPVLFRVSRNARVGDDSMKWEIDYI